jgi:hypothetical protein
VFKTYVWHQKGFTFICLYVQKQKKNENKQTISLSSILIFILGGCFIGQAHSIIRIVYLMIKKKIMNAKTYIWIKRLIII